MDDQDASRSLIDDENNSPRSMLATIKGAARSGSYRLARLLSPSLESARHRIQQSLGDFLTDPATVGAVQQNLARFANLSFRFGFRVDPNAELLFRFADWSEERHGRARVMQILLQSPLIQDPTFVDAMVYLSQIIVPWVDDEAPAFTQSQLDDFKAGASQKLLFLLTELAALEQDERPPSQDIDALVDYFENAPLPAEFKGLARMALGQGLLKREDPAPVRWTKGLSKRLGLLSSQEDQERGLRPFIPGLGDETLEFLVLSTTFFIQTYLLRHLVESLPELAQEIADRTQGPGPVDMDDKDT